MTWVADRGVLKLRAQVDAAAPDRATGSDGVKGDAAHAARTSQHNPEHPPPPGNPDYQVDAVDLTHDPAHGADMAVVTEAIRLSRDRRVLYVIFRGRIFSSYAANGRKAWEWGPYDGSDPHENHAHISVNDQHHDETQDWKIGIDMANTQGDIAAQWRLLSLLLLDPTLAKRAEITEKARLESVPLIDLLKRVDGNVAAALAALVDEPGPTEIILSDGQLQTIITEVTRGVVDTVFARLGNLRIGEVQG